MKEGERKEIQIDDIPDMFSTIDRLFQFVGIIMHDSYCILKLAYDLNVIPLALQITQIAGNLMNRTLRGGRAERNEFLLLHAFTEKDFILPDKMVRNFHEGGTQKTKTKSKAAYAGGLVLDPIKGETHTYFRHSS
jgi:DNA polymerase alpha subunit A